MTKYRRIEVNAFRRRVTIVSGEWPQDGFDAARKDLLAYGSFAGGTPALPALAAQTEDGVSLDDTDSCEPVEPDSPEGQLILVEAVRSLERRLLPEARATIHTGQNIVAPNRSNRNGFFLKLQSFYRLICPKALRFARKEK